MTSLEIMARQFAAETYIVNLLQGEWMPLFDDHGNMLPGIRGRMGVAHLTSEGHELGIDLIEMQPGSLFPLHFHDGDHIIYGVSGTVYVHVDGTDHTMNPGDTVFIPAELPHGVKTIPGNQKVSVFLAIGNRHKPLSATDRMHVV